MPVLTISSCALVSYRSLKSISSARSGELVKAVCQGRPDWTAPRDDAREGHVDDFKLNAEAVGDLLSQPHVAADKVSIETLEPIGGALASVPTTSLPLALICSSRVEASAAGCSAAGASVACGACVVVAFTAAASGKDSQQHCGAESQHHYFLSMLRFFILSSLSCIYMHGYVSDMHKYTH